MNTPNVDTPTPTRPLPRSFWARRRWRWPIKVALFLAVVFLTCFPYPRQFVRHVRHLANLQAMIEPDHPRLAEWEREVRQRLATSSQPVDSANVSQPVSTPSASAQRIVERFVLEKVQYEWDWNLWGSADYLPTVGEMFERSDAAGGTVREDCDGRAVMAASLMKRMGYSPAIVTDLRHVWVTTPEGEWMGPGGEKTMVTTPEGLEIRAMSMLSNVPISLSYGIAVFPLGRELVILAAFWLLMLRRGTRPLAAVVGLILLIQGLLFMRLGFFAPQTVAREVSAWPTWVGLGHVLAAVLALMYASKTRLDLAQTQ
jgi:hypothetical protein